MSTCINWIYLFLVIIGLVSNAFGTSNVSDSHLIMTLNQKGTEIQLYNEFHTHSQFTCEADQRNFDIFNCPLNSYITPLTTLSFNPNSFYCQRPIKTNETVDTKREKPVPFSTYREDKLNEVERRTKNDTDEKKEPSPQKTPKRRPKRNDINYASHECGAKVLNANPEAFNPISVVQSSKDNYMLNPCSSPRKWIVIELCEEIGVNMIKIANYEFFSSIFKEIQISGSNAYPTRYWELIGNFTAENVRNLQTFNVDGVPSWYKFIKISFISHWGNEFYCPVSHVQVYGLPFVEKLHEQLKKDSEYIHHLEEVIKPEETPQSSFQKPNHNTLHFTEKSNYLLTLLNTFPSNQKLDTNEPAIDKEAILQLQTSQFRTQTNSNIKPRSKPISDDDDDDDDDDVGENVTNNVNMQGVVEVFQMIVDRIKSIETNQSVVSGYLRNLTMYYVDEFNFYSDTFTTFSNETKKDINSIKTRLASMYANAANANNIIGVLSNEVEELKSSFNDKFTIMMLQVVALSFILSATASFSLIFCVIRFNLIPKIKIKGDTLVVPKRKVVVKKCNKPSMYHRNVEVKKELLQLKRANSF